MLIKKMICLLTVLICIVYKVQWGSLLLPSLIGPDCDRYFEEHRVPACPNKVRRLEKDGRLIRQTNMGTVPRSP
jgi:hypothetical protein